MLEQQLSAQEEKLDAAAAMGWLDDAEEELDADQRCAVNSVLGRYRL